MAGEKDRLAAEFQEILRRQAELAQELALLQRRVEQLAETIAAGGAGVQEDRDEKHPPLQ